MAKIRGIFAWGADERRSDRYGFITVTPENYDLSASSPVSIDDQEGFAALAGRRARITAVVVEARRSGHIGDLFRGFHPSTPKVGKQFKLGEGTLRIKPAAWSGIGLEFGLEPDDGRQTDWFDPRKLYKLHDQTVEITVEGVAP